MAAVPALRTDSSPRRAVPNRRTGSKHGFARPGGTLTAEDSGCVTRCQLWCRTGVMAPRGNDVSPIEGRDGVVARQNANDRAEQTGQRLAGRASCHSPRADRTVEARCIAKGNPGKMPKSARIPRKATVCGACSGTTAQLSKRHSWRCCLMACRLACIAGLTTIRRLQREPDPGGRCIRLSTMKRLRFETILPHAGGSVSVKAVTAAVVGHISGHGLTGAVRTSGPRVRVRAARGQHKRSQLFRRGEFHRGPRRVG